MAVVRGACSNEDEDILWPNHVKIKERVLQRRIFYAGVPVHTRLSSSVDAKRMAIDQLSTAIAKELLERAEAEVVPVDVREVGDVAMIEYRVEMWI